MKILVVDDHPLILEALERYVAIGCAVDRHRPIELRQELRERGDDQRVVVDDEDRGS